jgi:hypothetical protein
MLMTIDSSFGYEQQKIIENNGFKSFITGFS